MTISALQAGDVQSRARCLYDNEQVQMALDRLADEISEHHSAWEQFSQGLFYEPVDLQQPEHLIRLKGRLREAGKRLPLQIQAVKANVHSVFFIPAEREIFGFALPS